MKRIVFTALLLSAIFSPGVGAPPESIKQFIDKKSADTGYIIDNEYLFSGNVLPLFYSNRNFSPAWFTHNNLNNNGYALVDYIRQVDQQGLQPDDYHLCLIEEYIGETLWHYRPMDSTEIVKMDILLTDAFLLLASHLYYGKVDPEKGGASWNMQRKDPELRFDMILEKALSENNIDRELNMLAPRYGAYWRMKEELAFYLSLNEQLYPDKAV